MFKFLLVIFIVSSLNFKLFAEYYFDKGKKYYYQKNFDLAILSFEKVLSRGVTNDNIMLMLGNSYLVSKRYDDALEIFRIGLVTTTNVWAFWFNIGYTYYVVKDFANSMDAFRTAITINPNFTRSYWLAGMSAIRLADISNTILFWERYLDLDPDGEQADNIAKALRLLKMYGTNAIPEILKEIEEVQFQRKKPEDILSDLDKFINNGHSEVKSEGGRAAEDTSLEDIEK